MKSNYNSFNIKGKTYRYSRLITIIPPKIIKEMFS